MASARGREAGGTEVPWTEQFDLTMDGAYDELLIWNLFVEMSLYG